VGSLQPQGKVSSYTGGVHSSRNNQTYEDKRGKRGFWVPEHQTTLSRASLGQYSLGPNTWGPTGAPSPLNFRGKGGRGKSKQVSAMDLLLWEGFCSTTKRFHSSAFPGGWCIGLTDRDEGKTNSSRPRWYHLARDDQEIRENGPM